MRYAYMIMDLQFGSTGKGLLAGYLAEKRQPDTVVTAWGPNAGHTYIDKNGKKYIHTMLANGIVSDHCVNILIGPGTVLDADQLVKEVAEAREQVEGKRIIIHPKVAVLNKYRHAEDELIRIGSTMKGTAAANIQRIMRNPNDMNTADRVLDLDYLDTLALAGDCEVLISANEYQWAIQKSTMLQIEGAQGFSLSMYHGFYPYTTSRDVTPNQILADCAIPFGHEVAVLGTLRTHPIRVANRTDESGKTWSSGPCYADQREITWESLGVATELTTVTKLPRRVFTFSMLQLDAAIKMCNPESLFLNFANYLDVDDLNRLVDKIESRWPEKLQWIGHGPAYGDVSPVERGEPG